MLCLWMFRPLTLKTTVWVARSGRGSDRLEGYCFVRVVLLIWNDWSGRVCDHGDVLFVAERVKQRKAIERHVSKKQVAIKKMDYLMRSIVAVFPRKPRPTDTYPLLIRG